MARAEPAGLDRTPAVAAAVLVLFEYEVSLFAAIEIAHCRVVLLDALKVVQDRLAVVRQFHLRAEIHIHIEVIAQGVVSIHAGTPFPVDVRSGLAGVGGRCLLPDERSIKCPGLYCQRRGVWPARSGRTTASKRRREAALRPRKEASVARMAVFPSALGWIAMMGRGDAVEQITFGHESPQEAIAALADGAMEAQGERTWNPRLVVRLQKFIERGNDDFRDVQIELGPCTPFQRRVLKACRRVPYGRTMSYAELAKAAGLSRAARAVGNVMANNRFSLIVPCHRVLAAGGRLGGYSSRLGLSMKKWLLCPRGGESNAGAERPRAVKNHAAPRVNHRAAVALPPRLTAPIKC